MAESVLGTAMLHPFVAKEGVEKVNNLNLWDKVRDVPATAIKKIGGGRLSGMSDINPVWRLKTLTEQFGMCGVGWKYVIAEKRLETGANNEISAFVDINLFVKVDGEWSAAIPGTGGSSFVANEKSGLKTSDECFKMALTDAISVSCKALGIGADVYWDKDKTKYSGPETEAKKPAQQPGASNPPTAQGGNLPSLVITEAQKKRLFAIAKGKIDLLRTAAAQYGYTSSKEIKKSDYEAICKIVEDKVKEDSQ